MIKYSIGKVEICDGCGWKKKITFINDNGNGFCRDCIEDLFYIYHKEG